MTPLPTSFTNQSETTATLPQNTTFQSVVLRWFDDFDKDPTKVILVGSIFFHLVLFLCIFVLCCKYRKLQNKFKRLRLDFRSELDDYHKKETTKLKEAFYGNNANNQQCTRPGTTSTSGIYFDECLADQKLLSNPPHARAKRHTSTQSSTAAELEQDQIATTPKHAQSLSAANHSTPPTPLPRSKSKPEFSLPPTKNASNNNNHDTRTPPTTRSSATDQQFKLPSAKDGDDATTEPPVEDDENPLEKSGSWFIPITPAAKRHPKGHQAFSKVQHTPVTSRQKERATAGEANNNNIATSAKTLFAVENSGDSPLRTNLAQEGSPGSRGEMNPLSQLTLWEQHETRPVLKHAK